MVDAITHAALYAGWPNAMGAMGVLKAVLAERAGKPTTDTRSRRESRANGSWQNGTVSESLAAFATDPATAGYYDQRANEYDEWYLGQGRFAGRDRPGWDHAVQEIVQLVKGLPPGRTLDVACGTGFLTRHLRGYVVGIDQSRSMVALAQACLPDGLALVGDALNLVVADGAFDRVFTSHFYGHLPPGERVAFLAEARRVAGELVVVDSAARPGVEAEQWQERVLNDGSRHRVFKRYLTAAQLASEIDGEALAQGEWFVAARTRW